MTALARGVFVALVVATVAAFFVAQRLKSTPSAVQSPGVVPLVSPNQDGRFERTRIAFELEEADRVDVTILDDDGEAVRELVDDRALRGGERLRVPWDGLDDAGERVPDGAYRARVLLRRQGLSVVLPRTIVLDVTPPAPRVLAAGPEPGPGPELLPRADGGAAEVRFTVPGRRPEAEVWKTDDPRPRRVAVLEPEASDDGTATARWDGTRSGGGRAGPGTYVVVGYARDAAGNRGATVPGHVLDGRARPGEILPSRGGVTVRRLAVQPPAVPVAAGARAPVGVDARGAPWRWALRRVGTARPVRRGRRTRGGPFDVPVPRGESGLFLFEVRAGGRRARVPVAVDSRRRQRVLVVLPVATWQGVNRVDDDGDGLPNTLERGVPSRFARVMAGDGLPAGLARNEAPLLARLDRNRHRYDLTTDVALASGQGPELEGHRGVLLAGDTRWLAPDVRRRLRSFVAGGGVVASFGTRSLRATAEQTAQDLRDPSPPSAADAFGARIGPIRRREVDLVNLEDDSRLQLFAGEEGLFPGVRAWEATASVGGEARLLSSAVTPDGEEVIVGARFGRGVVVRTGIPGFATRLSGDPSSAELVERIWTILRAG